MDGSSNTIDNSEERVDFPSCGFKCLHEIHIFVEFFCDDNDRKSIVGVGDFYNLYGIWWS